MSTTDEISRIEKDSPFAALIDEAYGTFERPQPSGIWVCTCEACMPQDIADQFYAQGQRGLPYSYLRQWFAAATTADLPIEVWSWLLPRLLEALACGEEPAVSLELSLSRFPTGVRSNWTFVEWSILHRFRELFIEQLNPDTSLHCIDDVICMFVRAGWPTDELFAQVLAWPTSRLITQLSADWGYGGNLEDGGEILLTEFWEDAEKRQVREIWTSLELRNRMLHYADNNANPLPLRKDARRIAGIINAG